MHIQRRAEEEGREEMLEEGVAVLNLLMEHQAAHAKPVTVTSVGGEEAKGGVNRSWRPQPAPWTPYTAVMSHNKAANSSAPQKKTLHSLNVIRSFQSTASQPRLKNKWEDHLNTTAVTNKSASKCYMYFQYWITNFDNSLYLQNVATVVIFSQGVRE